MNVYQKVLALSRSQFAQFLQQVAEKNAGSTSVASIQKKMMAMLDVTSIVSQDILVLLLRLRQVCCHCGLIAAMLDPVSAPATADSVYEDLLQ